MKMIANSTFPAKNARPALALAAITTASFAVLTAAQASTPLGGLTVAVSPKGDQLVAGGDNRTLYVLDPKSLDVKKRIHLGAPIIRMGFSGNGAILAVSDNDGTLHLIETRTWKTQQKFNDRHRVSFSAPHSLVASAAKDYRTNTIAVNSTLDGKEVFRAKLDKEMPVAALGISPDGARLAVLLGANEDKDEPKIAYSSIPKDLKGLAKKDFELRNDGKTSIVQIYDLKSGKLLTENKTFFSMNSGQSVAVFVKDGLIFNEYGNNGLQITSKGEGRVVQFDGSFLYGSGVSHDGRYIMTGSLRGFTVLDAGAMTASTGEPEKLAGNSSEIDKLPGWPEYFKGFDATAGGKAFYGATSGYRVVLFDATGKVIKTAPVF
jgi:WD40 repeat protein